MDKEESRQLGFVEMYGVVAVRTFQVAGFVDSDGNEVVKDGVLRC